MIKDKHLETLSYQKLIKDLLCEGKTVEVAVFGYSMFPYLKPGVTVRLGALTNKEVSIGDVVVVNCNNKLLMHRLVKVLDGEFICKGDSMPMYDPVVLKENCLGVLLAVQNGSSWRTDNSFFSRVYLYAVLYLQPISGFVIRLWLRFYLLGIRFKIFKPSI